MLLIFSIAGAAALAVVAYTRLRARDPEAATAAARAVRELAAVILVCTKAVEGVIDVMQPTARPRPAFSGERSRGYDSYDQEEE